MHWLNLFAKFSVTERTADLDCSKSDTSLCCPSVPIPVTTVIWGSKHGISLNNDKGEVNYSDDPIRFQEPVTLRVLG